MTNTIVQGEAGEVLRGFPDSHFDSCVTDPPYELGFMGKAWDSSGVAYSVDLWREVLRVLKPGAHLLSFGGSRTYHRMACAIEDAGFEIRDQIMWIYGSGFPKSLDISKAIDKAAGAEREVTGSYITNTGMKGNNFKSKSESGEVFITSPSTDAARQWEGWGTALKPAFECLCFAQKPLTNEQHINIIGSNISRLEAKLWSLLSASVAEKNFRLSQNDYDAACAFAQWSAEEKSNTQAALSALMDTSLFELVMSTGLNIVWSWRSTWGALWNDGSTSITGTETKPTIDLKTLNSCLSALTPLDIIRGAMTPDGLIAHASPAVKYFSGEMLRLSGILSLSAQGSVTSNPPTFCPDADARPYSRPICVARKPFRGTVVSNVLLHGTGGLNIDGGRIPLNGEANPTGSAKRVFKANEYTDLKIYGENTTTSDKGRFPANVIHDGSEEVVRLFPESDGCQPHEIRSANKKYEGWGNITNKNGEMVGYHGNGSAARFFYCAKASRSERGPGNNHPTVKPLALIQYLVKLVTPPGGIILDPFIGSGTLGIAAGKLGMKWVGIEKEPKYIDIANRRIEREVGLLLDCGDCPGGPIDRDGVELDEPEKGHCFDEMWGVKK